MITQGEFIRLFNEAREDRNNRLLRDGQVAWDTLHKHAPQLAEGIRETSYDPYNDDRKLPHFWTYIYYELPA